MTLTHAPCTTAPRRPVTTRFSPFARLVRMHQIWQQRQVLKSLDNSALQDIGLTREEAEAEARRPLWDAPAGWTR